MNRPARFAVAGTSVLSGWLVLLWVLPRVGASLSSPPALEPFSFATPLVGGGDDVEAEFHENPVVYTTVPRQMWKTATESVQVRLEYLIPSVGRLQGHEPPGMKYTVGLESPAFEIAPEDPTEKEGTDSLQWDWLISPKEPGSHKLRVSFSEHLISPKSVAKLRMEGRIPEGAIVTGDSMIVPVEVLTNLGLTATQEALFTVLGALIGIVGTIAAYPFLKRFVEGDTNSPSTSPDPSSRRRKRRRQSPGEPGR